MLPRQQAIKAGVGALRAMSTVPWVGAVEATRDVSKRFQTESLRRCGMRPAHLEPFVAAVSSACITSDSNRWVKSVINYAPSDDSMRGAPIIAGLSEHDMKGKKERVGSITLQETALSECMVGLKPQTTAFMHCTGPGGVRVAEVIADSEYLLDGSITSKGQVTGFGIPGPWAHLDVSQAGVIDCLTGVNRSANVWFTAPTGEMKPVGKGYLREACSSSNPRLKISPIAYSDDKGQITVLDPKAFVNLVLHGAIVNAVAIEAPLLVKAAGMLQASGVPLVDLSGERIEFEQLAKLPPSKVAEIVVCTANSSECTDRIGSYLKPAEYELQAKRLCLVGEAVEKAATLCPGEHRLQDLAESVSGLLVPKDPEVKARLTL